MSLRRNPLPLLAFLSLVWFTSGCGDAPDAKKPKEVSGGPPKTVQTSDHDHGDPPHHGTLIELGNEEYHAELVHDEKAKTVTIYVLDSEAKKAVPIDAKEIVINLKHDGNPEQFPLTADPDTGDPEGKSSRFVSKDAELGEDLDHKGADPQLSIKIAGKSFTAKIAHEHGDHKHDDHKHDENK